MIIGRRSRTASLIVAAFGLAWMMLLITTGGFDTEILGLRVRSRDPFRPLFLAAIGLTVYVVSAGAAAYRRWVDLALRQDERLVVAAFAAITLGLGVAYSTTVAGGADAYGYVSQADRWLRGSLKVEQPWSAELPWPSRRWSASPLGYRPIDDEAFWQLVPIYSPGLPLMMAAAKTVGGHAAVFWIVPLCGALLVIATYGVSTAARLAARGRGGELARRDEPHLSVHAVSTDVGRPGRGSLDGGVLLSVRQHVLDGGGRRTGGGIRDRDSAEPGLGGRRPGTVVCRQALAQR